jgi:hypothetical protein
MDAFNEGYREEEYDALPDGVYQVEIVDVQLGTSKNSGLPMQTVEVKPEGSSMILKYYLVKNENYNKNVTKFFDCFGIRRGDFDYDGWMGKTGKAAIGKTEQGYHEIKQLIPVKAAGETAPQ